MSAIVSRVHYLTGRDCLEARDIRRPLVAALAMSLLLGSACEQAVPPQPAPKQAPPVPVTQSGAKASATDGEDEVVATVGSAPIRASQVGIEFMRRGADFMGGFEKPEQKQAILDEVIQREVLAQAAEQAGYAKDPEIVAETKRMMADRYWRDQTAGIGSLGEVSDAEIAALYESRKAEFSQPDRFRGSVVILELPAQATSQQKAAVLRDAEALRAKALAPDAGEGAFARLARETSRDMATADRGGDMGWFPRGVTGAGADGKIVGALFSLGKVGDISAPIETARGIAIVQLTDRKDGSVKPLAEVSSRLRSDILAGRQKEAQKKLYAAVKSRFEVAVNEQALARVAPVRSAAADVLQPPAFPLGGVK